MLLAIVGFMSCNKEAVQKQTSIVSKSGDIPVKSNNINYTPTNFDEIGTIYGQIHNSILDYVIYSQPIQNHTDIQPRIVSYFENNNLPLYSIDNSAYFNTLFPEVVNQSSVFHNWINSIRVETSNNTSLTVYEKDKFMKFYELSDKFINDGNIEYFLNGLNVIKQQMLEHTSGLTLTNPNQETVRMHAVIGIAQYSAIYWADQLSNGNILINNNDPGPAGLAPWALADAAGAAVGAVTSAGNYAVTGSGSWSGFAWDVLVGAGTASCGASITKWLKW